MNVVFISLELSQRIAISFVSLHDGSRSIDSRKNFRQRELSKATLEIVLFFVFFHALELLTERSVDVVEISSYIGQLCITVLLVQNHPEVETQIAVAPIVGDGFTQVLGVFESAQRIFNRLNMRLGAALNVG